MWRNLNRMTRRRPWLAALLSGLFPGLGQLYNGEGLKGLLFVLAGVITMIGPFNPFDVEVDIDDPMPGLIKMLLVSAPFSLIALWSAIDGYRRAKAISSAPPVGSMQAGGRAR